jgi:acetyl esterase/lipase
VAWASMMLPVKLRTSQGTRFYGFPTLFFLEVCVPWASSPEASRVSPGSLRRPVTVVVIAVLAAGAVYLAAARQRAEHPYVERLAGFRTQLTRVGPSPQPYQEEPPPPGVEAVTYRSGELALKAWAAFPKGSGPGRKVPAVVYFHGGFAFGADDFEDARPFLDAGFAVMCPTLRGENGNPGTFELYLGEVEDAEAAVRWLAADPRVDASRVSTFGHSAGGVISALLTLRNSPIHHSGSAGGLYDADSFPLLGRLVPFRPRDETEASLRSLVGNLRWMRRAHLAYVGDLDRLQAVAAARREAGSAPSRLTIITVAGDHVGMLEPAVKAFARYLEEHP